MTAVPRHRAAPGTVRLGHHHAKLFWLDLIGAVRGALNEAAEPPRMSASSRGAASAPGVRRTRLRQVGVDRPPNPPGPC
ncbi:MAG: hypothetical protein ACRDP3_01760 [Streptomyces sp.]|uniref:hypothetical protein n=1 Tax=Streptomyces sp. TaxID=1931 RepID=UPI003D6A143A